MNLMGVKLKADAVSITELIGEFFPPAGAILSKTFFLNHSRPSVSSELSSLRVSAIVVKIHVVSFFFSQLSFSMCSL